MHPDRTIVLLGDAEAKLLAKWRASLVMPEGDPSCRCIRTYADSPHCYLTKHFEEAGFVIVRPDWAILANDASMRSVQGGFFNATHRDAEDLSFEWYYQPGNVLTVIDTLRSDRPGPRHFVRWQHLPRQFELTGEAGRFRADDGELPVDITASSSCRERTTYEMVKDQTTPLQGWASLASREGHPRWARCEWQQRLRSGTIAPWRDSEDRPES